MLLAVQIPSTPFLPTLGPGNATYLNPEASFDFSPVLLLRGLLRLARPSYLLYIRIFTNHPPVSTNLPPRLFPCTYIYIYRYFLLLFSLFTVWIYSKLPLSVSLCLERTERILMVYPPPVYMSSPPLILLPSFLPSFLPSVFVFILSTSPPFILEKTLPSSRFFLPLHLSLKSIETIGG